jgi:glycine cleavage system aminomethyltransferase T
MAALGEAGELGFELRARHAFARKLLEQLLERGAAVGQLADMV